MLNWLVIIYCILSVIMFICLFLKSYILLGICAILMGIATCEFRYRNDGFLSNRDWSIVIFEVVIGIILILSA